MLGTFPKELRPAIAAFAELKRHQASPIRIVKILSHLRVFYKFEKKHPGKKDAADFFEHLELQGRSPETLNDFRAILAAFFRWKHQIKDTRLPPELEFLAGRKFKTVQKQGPTWDIEDLRGWVDHCLTLQDKALSSSVGLGGFRIGEVLPLLRRKVEIINRERQEYRFYVDGKTGPREVMVIDRWGFIGQHLDQFKGGPDDYLFPGRHGRQPTYFASAKRLRLAAQRAGINKRLNPHWLRHSRATQLAEKGASEAQMCAYLGWRPGSRMPARYLHTSGRTADLFIRAEARGSVDELVRSQFGQLESTGGRERDGLYKEFVQRFIQEPVFQEMVELQNRMKLQIQEEMHRNLTLKNDAMGEI